MLSSRFLNTRKLQSGYYKVTYLLGTETTQFVCAEVWVSWFMQVAVALSHAAVLEDSQRTRDKLVEQNTSLQRARQDAETAIRARNDFLAVMNHEMRTPMHAIIALSSLLQEGHLSQDQRSMVDTVVKSSSLLSTLINDVLDFSRLEDGSLHLEMRPFDLPTVLREADNLAKPMAKGKGLEFFFDIAVDVPLYVIGDEKRLLQTTLNIIGNAVKFTRQGYVSVVVSLEKYDGSVRRDPRNPLWHPIPTEGFVHIRITVKDTGMGVKENDIPRLFHKFVQADSTTTRQYGGTGLGLAICKKFVQVCHLPLYYSRVCSTRNYSVKLFPALVYKVSGLSSSKCVGALWSFSNSLCFTFDAVNEWSYLDRK